jgi:hypothetical protein
VFSPFTVGVPAEGRGEAVDGGCAGSGGETRAVAVRRDRVGAEVVVERHVLLEDHHQVLDRRGRGHAVVMALRDGGHRGADQDKRTEGRDEGDLTFGADRHDMLLRGI